jgi:hypothetical protein
MYDDHGIGDWPGGGARDISEGLGCLLKGFVALLLFAGVFHLVTEGGKWLILEVIGPTGCVVALVVMCVISVLAVLVEILDDVVSSIRYRRTRSRK